MATPDGMPVVWVGKWLGERLDRVCGRDLTLAVWSDHLKPGPGTFCLVVDLGRGTTG